jgi:hypothetical protein
MSAFTVKNNAYELKPGEDANSRIIEIPGNSNFAAMVELKAGRWEWAGSYDVKNVIQYAPDNAEEDILIYLNANPLPG